MAFTSQGTFGSGVSTSASSSVALTVNATLAVGRFAIVRIAKDNIATGDGDPSEVTSVTDTRNNTWLKAKEFGNGQGSAAAGAVVSLWYTVITTQIEIGDSVTANLSANVVSKAISGWYHSIAAGSTVVVAGSATLANDGADPGNMTVGSLTNGEYLWDRAIATEANSTTALTVTAGFTVATQAVANTGTSATSMGVRGEFIIATGTTKSSDPTLFGATDMASVFVAFQEIVTQDLGATALALAASFPTAGLAQGITPSSLALTAAFPTVSISAVTTLAPSSLALTAAFPTVSISAVTALTPASLALAVTFPAAELGQGITSTALALAAVFPTTSMDQGIVPSSLALAVVFPTVSISAVTAIASSSLALAVTFPTVSISAVTTLTSSSLALVATFPTAELGRGIVSTALALAAVFPTVSIHGVATLSLGAIDLTPVVGAIDWTATQDRILTAVSLMPVTRSPAILLGDIIPGGRGGFSVVAIDRELPSVMGVAILSRSLSPRGGAAVVPVMIVAPGAGTANCSLATRPPLAGAAWPSVAEVSPIGGAAGVVSVSPLRAGAGNAEVGNA